MCRIKLEECLQLLKFTSNQFWKSWVQNNDTKPHIMAATNIIYNKGYVEFMCFWSRLETLFAMKKNALLSSAIIPLLILIFVVQSARVNTHKRTVSYTPKVPNHQWTPSMNFLLVVACVLEGVEYEEGSTWQPEGPCSSCTCVKGETLCTNIRCPPTECLHPSKLTGKDLHVGDSFVWMHAYVSEWI